MLLAQHRSPMTMETQIATKKRRIEDDGSSVDFESPSARSPSPKDYNNSDSDIKNELGSENGADKGTFATANKQPVHPDIYKQYQELTAMAAARESMGSGMNMPASMKQSLNKTPVSKKKASPSRKNGGTNNKFGFPPFNMPSSNNNSDDDAQLSSMSQSERKRFREKKRRSDITQAIDGLTKILLKVEPSNLIQQNNLVYSTTASKGRANRASGNSQQPLNRTEIINHAAAVLNKLNKENEERKMQIIRLHGMLHDITGGTGSGPPAATPVSNQQQQHHMNMTMVPTQQVMHHQPMFTTAIPAGAPAAFHGAPTPVTMQMQMQQHPSFMPPHAYQIHQAPVPNQSGETTIMTPMIMTTTTSAPAPTGNSLAEQLYITQQLLEKQRSSQR
mmetsp:Transcript_18246/g.21105  ORF Transcript_18246/g.21105 Transcript_18246/m.21105 type:complete len:390 (+) Transcript_18246:98-1267(+)